MLGAEISPRRPERVLVVFFLNFKYLWQEFFQGALDFNIDVIQDGIKFLSLFFISSFQFFCGFLLISVSV